MEKPVKDLRLKVMRKHFHQGKGTFPARFASRHHSTLARGTHARSLACAPYT